MDINNLGPDRQRYMTRKRRSKPKTTSEEWALWAVLALSVSLAGLGLILVLTGP